MSARRYALPVAAALVGFAVTFALIMGFLADDGRERYWRGEGGGLPDDVVAVAYYGDGHVCWITEDNESGCRGGH